VGTWLLEQEQESSKEDDSNEESTIPLSRRIDRLRRDESLSSDERLSLAITLLNDQVPLSYRGSIITPAWLQLNDHVETALRWLEGEFPNKLAEIDENLWLSQLHHRRERALAIAQERDIAIDNNVFRAIALVSDIAALQQRWLQRRRDFPGTRHRGIAVLTEKGSPSNDELHVLLSASVDQFTPASEILDEAEEDAQVAEWANFDRQVGREQLDASHREIFLSLHKRIAGFVRCGQQRLDEWARLKGEHPTETKPGLFVFR